MNIRRSSATRAILAAALLTVAAAPAAHAGNGDQSWGLAKALFAGPLLLLIAVAAFAALCLLALSVHRMAWMADISERAQRNLEGGRALHCLWGFLCTVFVVAAFAVLINTKPVALLGVLLACAGVMLTGWGVIVFAASAGRSLFAVFGGDPEDTLAAIRMGLPLLFFVSVIPFVGWALVIEAALEGVGAVLAAMARPNPPAR